MQPPALLTPGRYGDGDIRGVFPALPRDALGASSRHVCRLELRCHGAAAEGGRRDAVHGGVQQRHQPGAVLLLHPQVQGQPEGSTHLAVRPPGVHRRRYIPEPLEKQPNVPLNHDGTLPKDTY